MNDDDLVAALKAVAHPVRLRILQTLSGAERNVGEIDDAAEIGQPTLSQQLAVLRGAGLVATTVVLSSSSDPPAMYAIPAIQDTKTTRVRMMKPIFQGFSPSGMLVPFTTGVLWGSSFVSSATSWTFILLVAGLLVNERRVRAARCTKRRSKREA